MSDVLKKITPLKKTLCVADVNPENILAALGNAGQPIILKGLVSHWPVVQKALESDQAICDYLLSFYQGQPVLFYEAKSESGGRFAYTIDGKNLDFKTQRAPLNYIFDHLLNAKQQVDPDIVYVGSTAVDRYLPGMREHNDLPLQGLNPLVSIWLGNRTKAATHFDSPDNIACCISGRRVFTLFPPDQLENLYIGPLHLTPSGQAISLVDFDNPDFEKFPRFRYALEHAQVAELEPGDALFVPSMWWHQVESKQDLNVLINYWWRNDKPFMDSPLNALFHAILSIRELSQKEKEAWKGLFDYYIFSEQAEKYSHIAEGARGFLDPLDEVSARKLRAIINNNLNK
ncbi:cupin-like domain-containing protein [Cellvibrio sp. pealriver]|uniref:cupin-like domain-containing protein n=1 Tax=Cellvibrio sp. pealriver TaxID=1622269 RepID=UPI00069CDC36|nr:cupin-like domain-containing protein [Cellvibrio sp. pealriver]